MNARQLFQHYLAPTSSEPLALPITKAKGSRMTDDQGKEYIDLIGGISVCNVGHAHPKVVEAIKLQAEKYLHIMVYGEVVQSPQIDYAQMLTENLPENLNSVYFVNSGAEAVEGAMKLAKRVTNRTEIIACENSYHGSTQGALSIIGDEYWRNAYRPLLPDIRHVKHNDMESLQFITEKTACIIIEPIQAEGGILIPSKEWMKALRKKCDETGALLIFDEIQTGFGRTGTLWGFQQFDLVPDVILLGKALGGGMPLGAFISSKEKMQSLSINPILGHLTTFGGHPVCCAAGKAAMEVLIEEELIESVEEKEALFLKELKHPAIKEVRHKGLMMAIELENYELVKKTIDLCISNKEIGVFSDWFLFASHCIRIVPPLNISNQDIVMACEIMIKSLDAAVKG